MGQHRRFSDEQVAQALKEAGGIKSHAAVILAKRFNRPCSRPAVVNYVKQSPELQDLLENIELAQGDFTESKLFQNIEAGNPSSIHFYLSTKAKDRGYTRRDEITGAGGGPVRVRPDYSDYTSDEIATIRDAHAAAAERAAAPANGSAGAQHGAGAAKPA